MLAVPVLWFCSVWGTRGKHNQRCTAIFTAVNWQLQLMSIYLPCGEQQDNNTFSRTRKENIHWVKVVPFFTSSVLPATTSFLYSVIMSNIYIVSPVTQTKNDKSVWCKIKNYTKSRVVTVTMNCNFPCSTPSTSISTPSSPGSCEC